MRSTNKHTTDGVNHVIFVAICILAPFFGMGVEFTMFVAIDEFYTLSIPVIVSMVAVPTIIVSYSIWNLSNKWYSQKTAQISTILVTTVAILTYSGIALLAAWPFI